MNWRQLVPIVVALAVIFVWAYGPTIIELRSIWDREPDYSHGYLVIPAAVAIAFIRRRFRPSAAQRPEWKGLFLVAFACAMNAAGGLFFLNFLDGWSIPVWILGCTWLFFGAGTAMWAARAAGFLLFMVPLPYRGEQLLSLPLQRVATIWSGWMLQCLSVPAISEGNTILLGNARLEVQQACNGLRTITGMVALAYVLCAVLNRPWWKKSLLAVCALPVAMATNALRIVATGLVIYLSADPALQQSAHDWSGRLMIPAAACMFFLLIWYFDRLWVEIPNNSLLKIAPERMETAISPQRLRSQSPST